MAFSTKQGLVDRAHVLIKNQRAGVGLELGSLEDEAAATVIWISRYNPRVVNDATLDGDGTAYQFLLTGLDTSVASWVNGFSRIRFIEHPIGTQFRTYIDSGQYHLFPDSESPTHIHFDGTIPASGTNNIRVSYTVPHTVDDTSSSVDDWAEPAYEYALACSGCQMYAALYGQSTDPAIEADSVDYGSKPSTWMQLADMFCKKAGLILGVDLTASGGAGSTVKAAGSFHDLDPSPKAYGGFIHRSSTQR